MKSNIVENVTYSLRDRSIFQRPARHQYSYKWAEDQLSKDTLSSITALQSRLKWFDIACCLCSMLGLALLLIDNEIIFQSNWGLYENSTVQITLTNNLLRGINLGLTVPVMIMLVYRHHLAFRIDQESRYIPKTDLFRRSTHLRMAIIEVLIHAFISVPSVEGKICFYVMTRIVCNFLSDFFMLVTMLRVYLVLRIICHLTKWTNAHTREICDLNEVRVGTTFVVRCLFKQSPFGFLGCFLIWIGLVSAYSIRIFERAYYFTFPIIDVS